MDATKVQHTPLTLHQGLDYAVIMRPGETTDTAFIQVKYPTDADMALLTVLAAAPDMLAALKTAAGNIRSLGPAGALGPVFEPYTVWLATVEAAIAKAEGR